MEKHIIWLVIILMNGTLFSQKKCYEDSIDIEGYLVSDCGSKKGVVNFNDKLTFEPGSDKIVWENSMKPFTGDCESCNPMNLKTAFRLSKVENGKINGEYFVNHPSGCIQEKGFKVMGEFDGEIKMYYDTTSAIREISNFVLGKYDGTQLFFKPNGDTIAMENYKVISKGDKIESILHGLQIEYFDNGKLKSSVNYNSGELDGEYKKFNEEGILVDDRTFKKGKETGKCISYFDNGKIAFEKNWRDGVKEGYFIFYYPNDSIKSKGFYKKGIPEGIFVEYFESRQIESKIEYSKGKIIKEQYWNEYGQDVTEQRKKEQESQKQSDSSKKQKSKESKQKDTDPKDQKSTKEKGKKESKKKTKEPEQTKEEEEL